MHCRQAPAAARPPASGAETASVATIVCRLGRDASRRTSVTAPACAMSTTTEQAERRARQKACSAALADSLQGGGLGIRAGMEQAAGSWAKGAAVRRAAAIHGPLSSARPSPAHQLPARTALAAACTDW